ncbi:MAG: SWIM zinc finger family protein, partial [Treponema sp.]|nr:SWIM zinc finger family protein [Treponema sp.]
MKNRYGVTPWGLWFIDVLDSYQMGERLDRGRRYANAGRVLSLELAEGRAVAKVEGTQRQHGAAAWMNNHARYRSKKKHDDESGFALANPEDAGNPLYRTAISFPPLKEAEQVYRIIENDPPLLARIAAGELPETFLQELKNKGINLIPRRWQEMKRSCTCPDWGDPCKHMAALYYIIASEIDADPHVLFRLRGMDLSARFGKTAVRSVAQPFRVTYTAEKKNTYKKSGLGQLPDLEEIPYCGELITSLLPSSPPFCERDFAAVMAEFYHRCTREQSQENLWEPAQADEEILAKTEHEFSRSHWTVQCPVVRPGTAPVLQTEDINGNKKRFSIYETFEYFVRFSSDDGTESYSFLFYLFKLLNLVCCSGAFIPYVLMQFETDGSFENETLKIIWRPFENLPVAANMLKAVTERECGMLLAPQLFRVNLSEKQVSSKAHQLVSGQSVVDLLSCAFLNEWVRRKFMLIMDDFIKKGSGEYHKLLNMFFIGMEVDVSTPALRSLPASIDRWLSVLHIDFSAYRYVITIKDLTKQGTDDVLIALNFVISMEVIIGNEDGEKKIPLSKCSDIEILRAPIALSNYLPEIGELTKLQKVAISEARLVAFLDSASSLLTRLGMTVNLPKALARELKPRLV